MIRRIRGAVPPARRLVGGLVVLLVGIAIGVAVSLVGHQDAPAASGSPAKPKGPARVVMSSAEPTDCKGPISPQPGMEPSVAQLFTVSDSAGTKYLMLLQVSPFRGKGTYKFEAGATGNLLALQPGTGGLLLGTGVGTTTLADDGASGHLDAVVRLASGTKLPVTGSWNCPSS